ncbi:MAG: hypothetical protein LBK25_04935 [Treponema sp.]|jgi:hypothetical protein|nr:hypothetical protein [Treponema sp.]
MQVFKASEGQAYTEYSLDTKHNKKKLTVAGVEIDLEASVLDDCQNILNITRNNDGTCVLGLEGKAGYVADIIIPPREFQYKTTGEGDEAVTEKIPLGIDVNAVVLKLWPITNECMAEEEKQTIIQEG